MTAVTTKPILPFTKSLTDLLSPFAEPMLRVTTGALLIPHGYGKLFNEGALEGTGQFFESVGMTPGYELALIVALIEFVGGLLLIVGLLTRPVAVAVAVFMAQAALFHAGNGLNWTEGGSEFPIFWMVAALFFAIRGGGYFSLDRFIGREF